MSHVGGAQTMHDAPFKSSSRYGPPKGGLYRRHRLTLPFHEVSLCYAAVVPPPKVWKQPGRDANGRLPFIRRSFSNGQPVEHAAV